MYPPSILNLSFIVNVKTPCNSKTMWNTSRNNHSTHIVWTRINCLNLKNKKIITAKQYSYATVVTCVSKDVGTQ